MDSSENYMKKIDQLQKNYFSTNNKNILFKKKQKLDCATNISKSIDLEEALNNIKAKELNYKWSEFVLFLYLKLLISTQFHSLIHK